MRASLIVLAAGMAAGAQAEPAPKDTTRLESVHGCWPVDASGLLTGVRHQMPFDQADMLPGGALRGSAASGNRYDFVFVGDGYTLADMGQYDLDVARVANDFFRYEPFITYRPYFRLTQVDVISPESGVDNDPVQGVNRDSALDMGYWCGGTERLLCINTGKAYQQISAAGVTDVDQVIALANSGKYGGAGYTSSELATAAGHNSLAVEIAIHEMGHSMGNLADEYDTGGPQTYGGGEPSAPNVSTLKWGQQINQRAKWHDWMTESINGFDGMVLTYEGARYSKLGIYRPSPNSMMRNLSRPFNPPSAEALIKELYRVVRPIEDGTPEDQAITTTDTIWVTPMRPAGRDLDIEWRVDGVRLTEHDGLESLDLSALGLDAGSHSVMLTVSDPTPMMRDVEYRLDRMTERRLWTIGAGCSPFDLNVDGVLDFGDVGIFVTYLTGGNAAADLNGDGFFDSGDISLFITGFVAGCD